MSPFAGTIPNDIFYETQRRTLSDLLGRGAILNLAVSKDDSTNILGWILAEEKAGICILHFLYLTERNGESTLSSLLFNSVPGTKPGILTHAIRFKGCRKWKLIPEIARRKNL